LDRHDAAFHDGGVRLGTQELPDDAREITEPRLERLIDDVGAVLGRLSELVPEELAQERRTTRGARALRLCEVGKNVVGELVLRARARRSAERVVGEIANSVERDLQDFAIEALFVAEVIVDGCDVRASSVADLAHGDAAEAMLREQPCRRVE
jgi:hypothetical protein